MAPSAVDNRSLHGSSPERKIPLAARFRHIPAGITHLMDILLSDDGERRQALGGNSAQHNAQQAKLLKRNKLKVNKY